MSHQRMPNAKLPLWESQVEKSLIWVTVVLLISSHHLANETFLFSSSYQGGMGRHSIVSKPARCTSNEHQSQHRNTWWILWLFTFLKVEKYQVQTCHWRLQFIKNVQLHMLIQACEKATCGNVRDERTASLVPLAIYGTFTMTAYNLR